MAKLNSIPVTKPQVSAVAENNDEKYNHLISYVAYKDDNKEYKLKYYDNCLNDDAEDTFTYVIIATGRSGSKFVKDLLFFKFKLVN